MSDADHNIDQCSTCGYRWNKTMPGTEPCPNRIRHPGVAQAQWDAVESEMRRFLASEDDGTPITWEAFRASIVSEESRAAIGLIGEDECRRICSERLAANDRGDVDGDLNFEASVLAVIHKHAGALGVLRDGKPVNMRWTDDGGLREATWACGMLTSDGRVVHMFDLGASRCNCRVAWDIRSPAP